MNLRDENVTVDDGRATVFTTEDLDADSYGSFRVLARGISKYELNGIYVLFIH